MPNAPVATSAPRIEAGAIWDVVAGPGGVITEVRFARCPVGWQASFELHDPAADELAICHRLVAPSLRDARTAVPQAIGFLLGYPVEDAR
jgi:hypothetical protein